jgi:hypothetical protein
MRTAARRAGLKRVMEEGARGPDGSGAREEHGGKLRRAYS